MSRTRVRFAPDKNQNMFLIPQLERLGRMGQIGSENAIAQELKTAKEKVRVPKEESLKKRFPMRRRIFPKCSTRTWQITTNRLLGLSGLVSRTLINCMRLANLLNKYQEEKKG